MDFALNQKQINIWRKELLSQATGKILEIGMGTGLNLKQYPETVKNLTVVEPNLGMHFKAKKRALRRGIKIQVNPIRGEKLPFEDSSFDTIVTSFTLCSIEGVEGALKEIFRVLKSQGKFLFLEHGLAPEAGVQKWQHRLNSIEKVVAVGCHLNRDIKKIINNSPLHTENIETFYYPKIPKILGYFYRGVAIK